MTTDEEVQDELRMLLADWESRHVEESYNPDPTLTRYIFLDF